MNSEVWRGQNSAKFIYFRYKDSPYFSLVILSISIIVCFLLILQIIIPQAQDWFTIRDEAIATRQKISIIQGNSTFMLTLNKSILERNRQLAIHALPAQKDFGEIVNAIAIAAVKSGVSVDDFSFSLGLVSSTSAELKKHPEMKDPVTKLRLSLRGDINKLKSFIVETSEKLPISQVESLEMSNGGIYISLVFYSKPYVAPRISEDDPIRPLSPENNSIFTKLSKWDEASSFYYENQQTLSPSSAVPLF